MSSDLISDGRVTRNMFMPQVATASPQINIHRDCGKEVQFLQKHLCISHLITEKLRCGIGVWHPLSGIANQAKSVLPQTMEH